MAPAAPISTGTGTIREHDTERAVMAGLELVTAVTNLNAQTPLQSRVGIATGLVVVGDLIVSGASQEQAIVAETPNLAARLQGIAEPNMVVIAERTRKLLGNLFELEDRDLKGIAGSVRANAARQCCAIERLVRLYLTVAPCRSRGSSALADREAL